MSTEPAKVEFKCSACDARLRAAADKVGKKIRCAYCREVVVVPGGSGGTTRAQDIKPKKGGTTSKPLATASGVSPAIATGSNLTAGQVARAAGGSGGTTRTEAPGVARAPVSASRAAALVATATTKIELKSQSAEAGQVDAAGVIAADSRRIKSRVHLIDARGDTARHTGQGGDASESTASGEYMSVHEGPPATLSPRWASVFRQNVGPDWRMWVPIALVAGAIGTRINDDLAAVYGLFGTAIGLLPPLLWLIIVRIIWRRPAVVVAHVASVISLGPVRFVSLRWSVGPDEADRRSRLILGTSGRGTDFARTDGRVMLALPGLRRRMPLLVVPHHISARLRDGAPAPEPGERYELTACPKCAGSGRGRWTTRFARLVSSLIRLALVANLAAGAWFGMLYLGAGAVALVVATVVALWFWFADMWPPFGCDQCYGRGQLRKATRPSVLSDLLIWGTVCWLLMGPLGWRFHEAQTELPRIHQVVDQIQARSDLDLSLDAESIPYSSLTAAAGFAKKIVQVYPVTPVDRKRPITWPRPHVSPMLPAVREYDRAVRSWVGALITLQSWEHESRRLMDPSMRAALDENLATARAGYNAALAEVRRTWRLVLPLQKIGQAGPTLWLPPSNRPADSFDRNWHGFIDHAVDFFAPLRTLIESPTVGNDDDPLPAHLGAGGTSPHHAAQQ
ncbi:MAG: hypothetical protein AB7K09_06130 [Planctomycetota bacterium]